MQLKILHKLQEELQLPIAYHHILQGIIYTAVGNEKTQLGDFFHNHGFKYNERYYKMFTFGLLKGKYRIKEKQIIFSEQMELEIRSPEIMLMRTLEQNIKSQGIHYGNRYIEKPEVLLSDHTIEDTEILIDMLSPITVYSTNDLTEKTYYYTPEEVEFYQQINQNFQRKYQSVYGVEPDEAIRLEPISISPKDRYVTKYKGIYITAWKGRYKLSGKRAYLDFLYQTGLGSKNSQGFGMFRVE